MLNGSEKDKDVFTIRVIGERELVANRTVLARENFLWAGSPLHTLAASLKGDEGMGADLCSFQRKLEFGVERSH